MISDYDESAALKIQRPPSHVKMGNGAFLLLKGTSKSNHVATLRRLRSIILLRFSVRLGLIGFPLYRILDFILQYLSGFLHQVVL